MAVLLITVVQGVVINVSGRLEGKIVDAGITSTSLYTYD